MAALKIRSRALALASQCADPMNGDCDAVEETFGSGVDMLLTGKYPAGP
jgi:hypothetical protein